MNNIFSDVMNEIEEYGAESKRLIVVAIVLSMVLGYTEYPANGSILLVAVVALCCFNSIRYLYRSEKGWCEIRTFKHHFILRCIFLALVAIYIIAMWALYFSGETDFGMNLVQFEIIFLICAVTSVRNGIRVRKRAR